MSLRSEAVCGTSSVKATTIAKREKSLTQNWKTYLSILNNILPKIAGLRTLLGREIAKTNS